MTEHPKSLEDVLLEVRDALKDDRAYIVWSMNLTKNIEGLPVLTGMLVDCIQKIAYKLKNDEAYLNQFKEEIYNYRPKVRCTRCGRETRLGEGCPCD